jgi:diguanylate cyclase (GGDEF)-like protein
VTAALPNESIKATQLPAGPAVTWRRAWASLWPRMSLRRWLTWPFVTLVTGLSLTIGILSYVTGSNAVNTMTEKLLLEMADRIGQAIDRHVVGSAAALEAAFPDGMPAPVSIDNELVNLRSRFWIATSLHLDPNNYVYYGNRLGQFFGLWRHSRRDGELRFKLKPEEPRSFQRFSGIVGALAAPTAEARVYDPRARPWYLAGQANSSHAWTSIYIDYSTSELVATRARRVLDAKGEFAGAVATDLSLRALNDFVRSLRQTPNGVAFIIEADGNLIASSRSANVMRGNDGNNARVNIVNSSDAVERAAFAAVQKARSAWVDGKNPGAGSLIFKGPADETIALAYEQIKDAVGLDWVVVVAVPRSDLLGGITRNVVRTSVVAASAALAALLMGLAILSWIARDLGRLALAARTIGEHGADVAIPIDRKDEIGELAQRFAQMQKRLRTDHLTGLVNREALVQRIDERITRHRRSSDVQGFAVLFIDIDDFKLVNDRWGHEAGDLVLIEIGKRLRATTRDEDRVCRYAGDEFVVLLDSVDGAAMAEQVRDKVDRALRQPFEDWGTSGSGLPAGLVGTSMPLSGSVGLAVFSAEDKLADDLIRRADVDMYKRKAQHKGRHRDGRSPA